VIRLNNFILKCQSEQEELRKDIESIKNGTEVIFQEYWDFPAGWSHMPWTNNHRVKQEGSVPYFKVEETLGNETRAIPKERTSTVFHTIYSSIDARKTFEEFAKMIWNSVQSMTKVRFPFIFFGLSFSRSVNEALQAVIEGCFRDSAVNTVLGIGEGVRNGAFRSSFSLRPCSGSVRLFAHAMDIPENQQMVAANEKKLAASVQCEQEAAATLTRYKETGLKERITHLVNRDREILRVFDDLQEFREVVTNKYEENEEMIRICASILMKLPDQDSWIPTRFRQHWQEFQEFQSDASFAPLTEQMVNSIVEAAEKALQAGRLNFANANPD
jgi:actin-related protein